MREEVPPEIIFDILSKLPVKSVLRCRCVSKTWCKIIDNPCLANSCMRIRASAAEKHSLLVISYPMSSIDRTSIHSVKFERKILRRGDHPIAEFANAAGYSIKSIGLGLIIFRNHKDIGQAFLFNPLRGEVLILPRATVLGPPRDECYGLGFDSMTGTYKVVLVFTQKPVCDTHDYMAEVYTLGTTSWRKISSIPPCSLSDEKPISAYGDVHWMIFNENPSDRSAEAMIVSFDTTKEEFKLTPHPNFHSEAYYFHLLDLRGSLAIVDFTSIIHIEIWVLKDYGRKEWAKEFRIPIDFWTAEDRYSPTPHILQYQLRLVGACEEGILFYVGSRYVYYNPKTDSISTICYVDPSVVISKEWLNPSSARVFSYCGSLVSLKNYGELMSKDGDVGNYFDSRKAGINNIPYL